MAGEAIPIGARLLKILVDIAKLQSGGLARPAALEQLRARAGWYDPRVLETLANSPHPAAAPAEAARGTASVGFAELRVGHVLRSNLETKGSMLLVTAGNKITPMLMHRLRNFSSLYGIQEPIFIEETGATFFTHSERRPAAA